MTLIELLIAITILGLVAAPLLHGFLTSAQTEVKARKMGEVTSVAQNVMETVEGNSFADAVKLTTYAGTGQYYAIVDESYAMPSDTPHGGDDYHMGFVGYPMNGKSYDVMVDIMASGYDQLNFNDKLSVNSAMDAVFRVPKSDVSDDRTITLNVSYTSAARDEIKFEVTHVLGTAQPTESATYTYDIPANGEKASIYLMYYPSYKRGDTGYVFENDTIKINNLQDIAFDLYLIKQKDTSFTNAELESLETSAICHLEQYLTGVYHSVNNRIGANIISNIIENVGNDSEEVPAGKITYTIWCGTNQGVKEECDLHSDISKFKTKEEASDRIYQVTVKVFENGSGFAGEPLSTLKGAILK